MKTETVGSRLTPDLAIRSVLMRNITYCATESKLKVIAEAVADIASRQVPGVYLEAGVALGGSAIVIASAKPVATKLHLFDLFEMLPEPGERDEPRAHEIYRQFLAGNRTDPIDRNYLTGVRNGLLQTVQHNLAVHGIDPFADNLEFHKGDFRDTLFVAEPIAFAHIDCDWYEGITLCLGRLCDHISPGGILVFDGYKSYTGAAQAVDEWLARDPRFVIKKFTDNLIVQRLADTPRSLPNPSRVTLPSIKPDGSRPRVLMLVDKSGWAYDIAALAIAKHLHLKVVAEGVENVGQCEFLLRNGCTYFQGYLFGKPVPIDQLRLGCLAPPD